MKKHLLAIACLGLFVSWFFINEVIVVLKYTNFQLLFSYIIAYTIAAGIIYGIIYALNKNVNKSWFLAQLVLFFLLMFGFAKDKLSYLFPFLDRYSIFIAVWLITGTISFILFNRSARDFRQFRNFLTVLLLIFIGISVIQAMRQPRYEQKLENIFTNNIQPSSRPNIYIFIFDEYSRLDRLNELGHPTLSFEQKLADKNVKLIPKTYSYTDLTSVCVPSMLNAANPDFSKIPSRVSNHDLYLIWNEYEKNHLNSYLNDLGYQTSLYGIMPMHEQYHNSSMNFRDFLMTDLLRQNTFIGRTNMQVGMSLAKANIPLISNLFYQVQQKTVHETYLNDSANLNLVKESLQKQTDTQPEFMVAHFLFPHSPYVRDEAGNYKAKEKILANHTSNDLLYIEQVKYTEKVIMELIDLVQQKQQETIAIFMGDHGYREHIDSSFNYQNFLAFYDSSNELSYHDSITYVNLMRNILNERFNFDLTPVEDSVQLIFKNKNK